MGLFSKGIYFAVTDTTEKLAKPKLQKMERKYPEFVPIKDCTDETQLEKKCMHAILAWIPGWNIPNY